MKKTAAILLAALMILGVFAGCTSGAPSGNTDPGNQEPDGQTPDDSQEEATLRFSWWGDDVRHKASLDAIKQFQDENPNIKIEAEYSGWDGYTEKLFTQLAGGTAPDLIQANGSPADLLQVAPYMVNMNDVAIDVSGFDSAFLENYCTVGDQLAGLPTGINAWVMFVNNSALKDVGMEPIASFDWDNILTYAQEFHSKNPDGYLLGTNVGHLDHLLLLYLEQMIGTRESTDDGEIHFTAEQATAMYEYYQKMLDANVFEPMTEMLAFEADLFTNPRFANRQFAAASNFFSAFTAIQNLDPEAEYSLVLRPVADGTAFPGERMQSSQLLCINKDSQYMDAAVKFVNWWYHNEEAILTLKDVRGINPTAPGREILAEHQLLDQRMVDALTEVQTIAGPNISKYRENSQIVEMRGELIQKVALGMLTPGEAGQELYDNYLRIITEVQ